MLNFKDADGVAALKSFRVTTCDNVAVGTTQAMCYEFRMHEVTRTFLAM